MGLSKELYTKKTLWILFSVCATSVHIWTFILFFNDFAWVAERTNAWDAVGVGSYGLVIALLESLFLLLCILALSLLLPKSLLETQKITLLGTLVFLASLWAIASQLYFFLEMQLPMSLVLAISRSSHPLWILYGTLFVVISITLLVPIALILKSNKTAERLLGFYERLTTLTALYLFLDFCSLVIVIIRNL